MQPPSDLSELRASVRSIDIGVRCLMSFVLLATASYATRVLFTVPAQQRIYEDMLGSLSKLPLLAKFLLDSYLTVIVLTWLVFLVAVILLWVFRRPALALFCAGFGAFILWCFGAACNFGLQMPLMQIIQGINGSV